MEELSWSCCVLWGRGWTEPVPQLKKNLRTALTEPKHILSKFVEPLSTDSSHCVSDLFCSSWLSQNWSSMSPSFCLLLKVRLTCTHPLLGWGNFNIESWDSAVIHRKCQRIDQRTVRFQTAKLCYCQKTNFVGARTLCLLAFGSRDCLHVRKARNNLPI